MLYVSVFIILDVACSYTVAALFDFVIHFVYAPIKKLNDEPHA